MAILHEGREEASRGPAPGPRGPGRQTSSTSSQVSYIHFTFINLNVISGIFALYVSPLFRNSPDKAECIII